MSSPNNEMWAVQAIYNKSSSFFRFGNDKVKDIISQAEVAGLATYSPESLLLEYAINHGEKYKEKLQKIEIEKVRR